MGRADPVGLPVSRLVNQACQKNFCLSQMWQLKEDEGNSHLGLCRGRKVLQLWLRGYRLAGATVEHLLDVIVFKIVVAGNAVNCARHTFKCL